jgi:hypothetical protein
MAHKAYSDEEGGSPASRNPVGIPDFPSLARPHSSFFRMRYLYFAMSLIAIAGIGITSLSLDLLLRASGSDPLIEIAIITLLVWVFPAAYFVARARDFYLSRGVLHLPLPIRRPAIGRTWEVALSDVVRATRIAHEDGDTGVLLQLNDGVQARLWLGDMPPGGGDFLELLLQKFGT